MTDATWHLDAASLRAYADGHASTGATWSAETHLARCAPCRTLLGRALTPADRATLDALRGAIELPPQRPRPAPAPRRTARLALRGLLGPAWAWVLLAGIAVALFAGAAALPMPAGSAPRAGALVVAPLVPVAVVAAVYALADDDPTVRTTTRGGFELVLLRTAAVLLTALPLVGTAQALIGTPSTAWLLPSLVLTSSAVALGSWIGVERGALAVTGGWTALVLAGGLGGLGRTPGAGASTVDLGPVLAVVGTTPLWAGLLCLAGAVLVLRRHSFDTPGRVL